MERRVENLEKVTVGIRETLARLDARTDALKEHNASKADMSDLKSSLIQWFVGTAIAMTALASAISFGLARFLQ